MISVSIESLAQAPQLSPTWAELYTPALDGPPNPEIDVDFFNSRINSGTRAATISLAMNNRDTAAYLAFIARDKYVLAPHAVSSSSGGRERTPAWATFH